MSKPRILFFEIVPTDPFRLYRSHYYPFLAGYANACHSATRWLTLGVDLARDEAGRNLYVYPIPANVRERLLQQIQDFNPTHVLINERLEEDHWSDLRGQFPRVSFRMTNSTDEIGQIIRLLRWLGLLTTSIDPKRTFQEQVEPVYRWEAINEQARKSRFFIPLLAGPECLYCPPVRKNPLFANVDLPDEIIQKGCSFCGCTRLLSQMPRDDVVALALRQVLAAERTLPTWFKHREYLVRGANLLQRIKPFFEALIAADVPASGFWFGCRLDDVLLLEKPLRQILPSLDERGFRLHFWSIGIENFSSAENDRFNKGLSPDIIERGILTLRDLHRTFPRAFLPPKEECYGSILFTPWTTIDDLRRNIAWYRKLDLPFCEAFLARRLELMPNRAITQLARKDGLIVDGVMDPGNSGCRVSWNTHELPWGFKEPMVARVFWIARRMITVEHVLQDDTIGAGIRAWKEGLPYGSHAPLNLFEALLDAVSEASAESSTFQILSLVEARLGVRSALDIEPFREMDDETAFAKVYRNREQQVAEDRVRWARVADRIRALLSRGQAGTLGDSLEESVRFRRSPAFGLEIDWPAPSSEPLQILIEERMPGRPFFLADDGLTLSYASGSRPPSRKEAITLKRFLRVCVRAWDPGGS